MKKIVYLTLMAASTVACTGTGSSSTGGGGVNPAPKNLFKINLDELKYLQNIGVIEC